jgi:hypothetical protein
MNYLFLSYCNRSGSTYLANLLSRSPEICVCPEAEIIYELLLTKPNQSIKKTRTEKIKYILRKDKKFGLWKLVTEKLIQENQTGFDNFLNILDGFQQLYFPLAKLILFKHNYLIHLKEQLADERFYQIHLLRDPRAVFSSQKSTVSPYTGMPMSNNVLAFTDNWNNFMFDVLQQQNVERVFTIKYEDVITNCDITLNALTSRLPVELKWENFKYYPAQLVQWISDEYKPIHQHIEKEPLRENLFKWKEMLSAAECGLIEKTMIPSPFYPKKNSGNNSNIPFTYLLKLRFKRKLYYLKKSFCKKMQTIFKE